MTELETPTN